MIEFRFKADTNIKAIATLNKHTPAGKTWRCDLYTGEHWLKIKQDENTQRFNDFLTFFLEIHSATHTLKIIDCNTKATLLKNNLLRPALF